MPRSLATEPRPTPCSSELGQVLAAQWECRGVCGVQVGIKMTGTFQCSGLDSEDTHSLVFQICKSEHFELGPSPEERLVRLRNFNTRSTFRFPIWEQTQNRL